MDAPRGEQAGIVVTISDNDELQRQVARRRIAGAGAQLLITLMRTDGSDDGDAESAR
jgi:hypothetical protein